MYDRWGGILVRPVIIGGDGAGGLLDKGRSSSGANGTGCNCDLCNLGNSAPQGTLRMLIGGVKGSQRISGLRLDSSNPALQYADRTGVFNFAATLRKNDVPNAAANN